MTEYLGVELDNEDLETLATTTLARSGRSVAEDRLALGVLRLRQEHAEYAERMTKALHESQDARLTALTMAAERLVERDLWKDRASAWQEQEMMSPGEWKFRQAIVEAAVEWAAVKDRIRPEDAPLLDVINAWQDAEARDRR